MKVLKALRDTGDGDLAQQFREATVERVPAIKQNDRKTINRLDDYAQAIYQELRSRGRASQDAMLPLLADDDRNVRGAAAAWVLDFAPDRAIPVLEALVETPMGGIAASLARASLIGWRQRDGTSKA